MGFIMKRGGRLSSLTTIPAFNVRRSTSKTTYLKIARSGEDHFDVKFVSPTLFCNHSTCSTSPCTVVYTNTPFPLIQLPILDTTASITDVMRPIILHYN